MVRNFKGVVKVADVKEEFDNLINQINSKINTYNSSLDYEDIDYNNVGPELAPMNYTLSVGGLKSVLAAYEGAVLGANVLRTGNNTFIVSEGICIKDGQVYRLPSKAVTGSGEALYFNSENNTYTFDSESSGKLYPDSEERVIIPAGTYPATVYTGGEIQNIDVTLDQDKLAYSYLTNETTNKMQTSTCKMTTYASFSQQYDWNTLTPDCLLDPTSPQYADAYSVDPQGSIDSDRTEFTMTIPVDLHFGSKFIYGVKLEIEFSEASNSYQSFRLQVRGSNFYNFSSFNNWKLQAFAYDENDNLLKSGNISVGGTYSSSAYISEIPANTKKFIICAIGSNDVCGTLYSAPALIKVSNPERVDFINLDVDCCLMYDEDLDSYSITSYMEGYNNLLGSAHFINNTNTLEYIQLDHGGPAVGNIFISKINPNRISRLCNTQNALNEDIPGYEMKLESKSSGYVINANQSLSNDSKGQFFSGSAGRNCRISLFDTQVAYHQWHGDRNDSYWEPFSYMFIPKGISNPYSGLAGETRFAAQKVWDYILNRPNRD